jgi:hypothetical protein
MAVGMVSTGAAIAAVVSTGAVASADFTAVDIIADGMAAGFTVDGTGLGTFMADRAIMAATAAATFGVWSRRHGDFGIVLSTAAIDLPSDSRQNGLDRASGRGRFHSDPRFMRCLLNAERSAIRETIWASCA